LAHTASALADSAYASGERAMTISKVSKAEEVSPKEAARRMAIVKKMLEERDRRPAVSLEEIKRLRDEGRY